MIEIERDRPGMPCYCTISCIYASVGAAVE